MEEALNPFILTKSSAQAIQGKAQELGMFTIVQDSLIKSMKGLTTVEDSLQLL
jgi:hypothetical protein